MLLFFFFSYTSKKKLRFLRHLYHFQSCKRRIKSFIPSFGTRSFDRLFKSIGSYDPKGTVNTGFQRYLGNALSGFCRDELEMRSFALDKNTETNDGVILPGKGNLSCHERNLKRSRNLEYIYGTRLMSLQTIEGTGKKRFREEAVESRENDRKFFAFS